MIGTVSHGTLCVEDLLSAFADELEAQIKAGNYSGQVVGSEKRAVDLITEARAIDPEAYPEEAAEIVNELQDKLDACAPPYVRFGPHEDDGADFGFWPCIDLLEDDVRGGSVLKLNAGDALPADAADYDAVMFVTDHGNITVGYADEDGDFVESWSCV